MRVLPKYPLPLSRAWWVWGGLILLFALAGTSCVVLNPYLWFDEAGQFFISLGLSHWSPPGAPPAGLAAMLHYNNKYLFDPFGYTLLFRGWQEVSTAAPWLRLLPFSGFCGLLLSAFRLLQRAGVRGPVALLLVALLPSSPLLYQHAGEIRPYIFEAWGALFCGCVLLRFGSTTGGKYPLLAGMGMAAFMWLRYPFVIAAGITGFLLLVQVLVTKPPGGWGRLIVYALPQIASAAAIYLLCIRHQPITPQMPPYGMPTTLKYNPSFLLHPWTMVYHLLVVGFLGVALFSKKIFPRRKIKIARLALFMFLLFAIWNFFSLIGKISADPNARWGIELNAVAVVCGLLLTALLLERLPQKFLMPSLILVGLAALCRPALQTYYWSRGNVARFRGEVYVKELGHMARHYKGKIWSPSGSTPEIKYLFEWGTLQRIQQAGGYPGHFVFLNQQNEIARINNLPLNEPVLWVDFPNRYTAFGRHQSKPLSKSRGVFYWLWRVK